MNASQADSLLPPVYVDPWGFWRIYETSGDASFVVAAVAAIYAFFFDGPWWASIAAASYWAFAEVVLQFYSAALRRKSDQLAATASRLRLEIAMAQAEAAAIRAETEQTKLRIVQMELLIAAKQTEASQLRTEYYAGRLLLAEMDRRKAQGEIEAKAVQLEIEYKEIEAHQLEVMANQLDIRAGQLEARMEQTKIWRAVQSLQENVEDRIIKAYGSGFIHGQRGASFANPGRHLRIVNNSA